MGLSSKKVCSSGLDWNQGLLEKSQEELELNPKAPHQLLRKQQQQQPQQQSSEAVKCPRCDSTNTKFCYYNNYNKSQPRHFCRACKRHWTKGGTLRNVPVGGGRKKNKRVIKKSITPTTTTTTSSTSTTTCTNTPLTNSIGNVDAGLNSHMAIQSSLLLQQNLIMESKDFGIGNNGIFLGSTLPPPPLPLPLPQNQTFLFPFSTSSSLQSSNVYNYGEELKAMEEPTINSIMGTQPWEIAATSVGGGGGGGGMGIMSNYWSWEDIDSLVSTDPSNNPWDDHNSDIKPL